jgi:hypothetical protein
MRWYVSELMSTQNQRHDHKFQNQKFFLLKSLSLQTFFISIDLKAFERRLMETVSHQRPATRRWRVILAVSSLMTSASAFYWLNDPMTAHISLIDSLFSHYLFTINCIVLITLFAMGIHKRVVATSM